MSVSNGSRYSTDKAAYHHDRIAAMREGKQPSPVHVQIILSDKCSHGCIFCSYRWDGNISNEMFYVIDEKTGEKNHNPNRMLPYDKVIEVLNDCKEMGVRAIQYTGGGEPTVYPRHHDIFRHTLDLGLELSLVTHGVLLKQPVIDTLASAAWVRVSVDAGKPETYSAIRRVGKEQYHRAITSIGLLCDARDKAASPLVVGVGFVVTKDNWREVIDAATLAKALGADSFRISAVFQPDGEAYFSDFYEDAAELCRSAELLSDTNGGRFKVTNSFGNRVADLHQGSPEYKRCGYIEFTTYLAGNGLAFFCCNTSYNHHGLIGSFLEKGFKALWESEEKRKRFAEFDARSCERCQFLVQNRAINAALDPAFQLPILENVPQHVNFV